MRGSFHVHVVDTPRVPVRYGSDFTTLMADENPPAPSEASDDVTKSETIRITLPPKGDQPAMKRETVRINVPGKPIMPPAGVAPKKETTKLPSFAEPPAAAGAVAPPPAGVSKPFIPPPPGSRPAVSGGLPAVKPLTGTNPPPKPPSLGARPTVPLKPTPAPSAPGAPVGEPVTQKAAAPKKETARITLPPEGATKAALPKATVKMQQTQPLVKTSAPSTASPTLVAAPIPSGPTADPLIGALSWAMLLISLAAAAIAYLIFSTASNALPV